MKRIFAIGALLLGSVAMFAQPQLTKDNIDEVVAAMTLEEKATLLVGSGWGSMNAGSMTASATILSFPVQQEQHTLSSVSESLRPSLQMVLQVCASRQDVTTIRTLISVQVSL